jgi:hypothetical protein
MTAETIIAITAVIAVLMSIVSIIITILFSKKQIEHNKNSVRPICDIRYKDYEDKISVSILNAGTGPIIIENLVCKNHTREAPKLISLMPKEIKTWTTFCDDLTGKPIAVGGERILIELNPKEDDKDIKYSVRNALKDITVYVEYKDIFDTIFEAEQSLVFFGRTLPAPKSCEEKSK